MEIKNRAFYEEAVKECIQCNACTHACTFLTKYDINLSDIDEMYPLAYHCFLCGECKRACPVDIDGRALFLHMRQDRVEEEGNPKGKGYGAVIAEKYPYKFRNYRHAVKKFSGQQIPKKSVQIQTKKSALFPGCNFMSFFPKTADYLVQLLKRHDIGVIYDCCGKPISELGMQNEEVQILDKISANLKKSGIEELVILCPNCYYFFKGRLDVSLVSIYEKLEALGEGHQVEIAEPMIIFPPCPDRDTFQLLNKIKPFVTGEYKVINEIQCCGLGGVAMPKEPILGKDMSRGIAAYKRPEGAPIYTYCATCSGNIARAGAGDVRHLLTEILGTKEQPDIKKSLWNRAKHTLG